MPHFSLHFFDRTSLPIDIRPSHARDVGQAMGDANRRLYACFREGAAKPLDPCGRVDVLNASGMIVARIYCAEAIVAMS
ncbi:hypothetical protein DC429_17740 [Arthrobacter sp. TPD3018]|uniref:hypothetical protein n=1 Tax=Bacteria TaxID=2 RepID=UPI000D508C11|nr:MULTISPECIES: hypothetical protein [Bacteria]PVE50229.1 hypothetical protein DC425_18450 [Sphingomonas sp. TPD3009]PVE51035.1 hypothetical protein DC429_17740 [Arthrobacter sp. TPD3018]PVE80002.1 hypothetical protein DC431_17045 [Sphingomonas melonis]